MKHLLIIYHSQSGNTAQLAQAVMRGCQRETEVETRLCKAFDAGLKELLWADGLLFGTPENFGTMSGALKDFFDRTFYEVEGRVDGKPYCMLVGAGNDGTGALTAIRRICNGYNFKEVQQPIVVVGDLEDQQLQTCRELGMAMAAGLEAGIF